MAVKILSIDDKPISEPKKGGVKILSITPHQDQYGTAYGTTDVNDKRTNITYDDLGSIDIDHPRERPDAWENAKANFSMSKDKVEADVWEGIQKQAKEDPNSFSHYLEAGMNAYDPQFLQKRIDENKFDYKEAAKRVAVDPKAGQIEFGDLIKNPYKFWTTDIASMAGSQAAFATQMAAGFGASLAIGAAAPALGLGAVGTAIVASGISSVLSRHPESLAEANQSYNEAKDYLNAKNAELPVDQQLSEQEIHRKAYDSFDETYNNNVKLIVGDVAELGLAFATGGVSKLLGNSVFKTGVIGGASRALARNPVKTAIAKGIIGTQVEGIKEGAEEVYQESVQQEARNKYVDSNEQKSSEFMDVLHSSSGGDAFKGGYAMGALTGGILTGVSHIANKIARKEPISREEIDKANAQQKDLRDIVFAKAVMSGKQDQFYNSLHTLGKTGIFAVNEQQDATGKYKESVRNANHIIKDLGEKEARFNLMLDTFGSKLHPNPNNAVLLYHNEEEIARAAEDMKKIAGEESVANKLMHENLKNRVNFLNEQNKKLISGEDVATDLYKGKLSGAMRENQPEFAQPPVEEVVNEPVPVETVVPPVEPVETVVTPEPETPIEKRAAAKKAKAQENLHPIEQADKIVKDIVAKRNIQPKVTKTEIHTTPEKVYETLGVTDADKSRVTDKVDTGHVEGEKGAPIPYEIENGVLMQPTTSIDKEHKKSTIFKKAAQMFHMKDKFGNDYLIGTTSHKEDVTDGKGGILKGSKGVTYLLRHDNRKPKGKQWTRVEKLYHAPQGHKSKGGIKFSTDDIVKFKDQLGLIPAGEYVEQVNTQPKASEVKSIQKMHETVPVFDKDFDVIESKSYTEPEHNQYLPTQQKKFNQGNYFEPVHVIADPKLIELISIGASIRNSTKKGVGYNFSQERKTKLEKELGITALEAHEKAKEFAKKYRSKTESKIIVLGNKAKQNEKSINTEGKGKEEKEVAKTTEDKTSEERVEGQVAEAAKVKPTPEQTNAKPKNVRFQELVKHFKENKNIVNLHGRFEKKGQSYLVHLPSGEKFSFASKTKGFFGHEDLSMTDPKRLEYLKTLEKNPKVELKYTDEYGGAVEIYHEGKKIGNVSKNYAQEESTSTKVDEKQLTGILDKLSKRFGLKYKIDNTIDHLGEYTNGEVIINPELARLDTPFHEFAHPFVLLVENENPKLYASLVKQVNASKEGKAEMAATKKNYSDLSEAEQMHETIVSLIGKSAANQIKDKTLAVYVKAFVMDMVRLINNALGIKLDVKKFNDATIDDIAGMLTNGTKDIDLNNINGQGKQIIKLGRSGKSIEFKPTNVAQVYKGITNWLDSKGIKYDAEHARTTSSKYLTYKDGDVDYKIRISTHTPALDSLDNHQGIKLSVYDDATMDIEIDTSIGFTTNDIKEISKLLNGAKKNVIENEKVVNSLKDIKTVYENRFKNYPKQVLKDAGILDDEYGINEDVVRNLIQNIEFHNSEYKRLREEETIKKENSYKTDIKEFKALNGVIINTGGDIREYKWNIDFTPVPNTLGKSAKNRRAKLKEEAVNELKGKLNPNKTYQQRASKSKQDYSKEYKTITAFLKDRGVDVDKENIEYESAKKEAEDSPLDKAKQEAFNKLDAAFDKQIADYDTYQENRAKAQAKYNAPFEKAKAEQKRQDDLDNLTEAELIERQKEAGFLFNKKERILLSNKIAKKIVAKRLASTKKNNPGYVEDIKMDSPDIDKWQVYGLALSQFTQKHPVVQEFAKRYHAHIVERENDFRKQFKILDLAAKKVLAQRSGAQKVYDFINPFEPSNAKYFSKLIDAKGNFHLPTSAEYKALTPAEQEYITLAKKLTAQYKDVIEQGYVGFDENAAPLVDQSMNEAYRGSGLFVALKTWLQDTRDVHEAKIKYNGKEMTFGAVSKLLEADYAKGNAKEKVAAVTKLLSAKVDANKALKKISAKDAKLSGAVMKDGHLINRFMMNKDIGNAKSTDVHRGMVMFLKEMTFTKHTQEFLPMVQMILDMNNSQNPDSNISKYFELWSNREIYKVKGVELGGEKAVRFAMNWARWAAMSFNLPASGFNVVMGEYTTFKNSNKDYLKGKIRWGANFKKGQAIAEKYNVAQGMDDFNPKENIMGWLGKVAFIGQAAGENLIQKSAFLGQIPDVVWANMDNEGNAIDKNKPVLTIEDANKYKENVTKVQGKYNAEDKRNFSSIEWANMLMQFKVWMPDFFFSRLEEKHIDIHGQEVEGNLRSLPSQFKKLLKSPIETWNSDVDVEAINARKNLKVLMLTGGAYLLSKSVFGDKEDKEKAAYLQRLIGDAFFFYDPKNWKQTLATPAAPQTIIKFATGLKELMMQDAYQRSGKGYKRGELKGFNTVKRTLPGNKVLNILPK